MKKYNSTFRKPISWNPLITNLNLMLMKLIELRRWSKDSKLTTKTICPFSSTMKIREFIQVQKLVYPCLKKILMPWVAVQKWSLTSKCLKPIIKGPNIWKVFIPNNKCQIIPIETSCLIKMQYLNRMKRHQ